MKIMRNQPENSSDITNSWRGIHLQLPVAFAQEIFDGTKILLADRPLLVKFGPTYVSQTSQIWTKKKKT